MPSIGRGCKNGWAVNLNVFGLTFAFDWSSFLSAFQTIRSATIFNSNKIFWTSNNAHSAQQITASVDVLSSVFRKSFYFYLSINGLCFSLFVILFHFIHRVRVFYLKIAIGKWEKVCSKISLNFTIRWTQPTADQLPLKSMPFFSSLSQSIISIEKKTPSLRHSTQIATTTTMFALRNIGNLLRRTLFRSIFFRSV